MKVTLNYEWEFSEKEWKKHQEFLEDIKKNPKVVLEYDVVSTFHHLNGIAYPSLAKYTVEK